MKASIKYGEDTLAEVSSGNTVTLQTENMIMKHDLSVSLSADNEDNDIENQIDWQEEDDNSRYYLRNRPTLGALAAKDTIQKNDLAADLQSILNTISNRLSDDILFFVGTQAQYDNANAEGKVSTGALVIILDENEADTSFTSILGKAILGLMVLGRF